MFLILKFFVNFVLNTKDNLGKFDAKSNEDIFVGYANTSKAYSLQ